MGANFGWVDFSSRDRDAVGSVLDYFKEKGVVDELGIGTVRDALADKLFPGINTIQTRAKYFLLPSVIVREYYRTKPRTKLADYYRKMEDELIEALAAKYRDELGEAGQREPGIMGIRLSNAKNLARKPSSVYWYGIRLHQLIRTSLSLPDYLQKNNRNFSEVEISGDDETDDIDAGLQDETKIDMPAGIGIGAFSSIKLDKAEADYLEMKFQTSTEEKDRDNLLTYIFRSPAVKATILKADSFEELYNVHSSLGLPDKTVEYLGMAKYFSEMMFGSHLLYNKVLRRIHGQRGRAQQIDAEWNGWLAGGRKSARSLDVAAMFQIAKNVHPKTKRFIEEWHKNISQNSVNVPACEKLVIDQETWNKKGRARLPRRGDKGLSDKDYGIGRLDYRFFQAKAIIKDIHEGVQKRV